MSEHHLSGDDEIAMAAGIRRAPRLALLFAITLAWLGTLAWPPPPAHWFPRVDPSAAPTPGYPARVTLPETTPVDPSELAMLMQEWEAIAALDLPLPPPPPPPPPVNELPRTAAGPAVTGGQTTAGSTPATDPARTAPNSTGPFLQIDYNLASLDTGRSAEDGALTIRKPLFVDGRDRGAATIRIEEGAQLFIATDAVASALGPRRDTLPRRITDALARGGGFIPFHELRTAGVAVEYDAARDRVSLTLPS